MAHNDFLVNRFFNELPIRVIGTNENPFFYASDIGAVLGIVNVHTSIKGFDDDEIVTPAVRQQHNLITYQKCGNTMRQNSSVVLLTELGVYRLIINSQSPLSKQFRTFIFDIIKETRLAEIVKLNIQHTATIAQYTAREAALVAKLAEVDKHNPIVHVFSREIDGNPYDYIPSEDIDHEMYDDQSDSDMLYKCTTQPTPSDYSKYTLIAKVFGDWSTIWGSIEGEKLYLGNDKTISHTKYFVDDEPEFNEGDVVRCD